MDKLTWILAALAVVQLLFLIALWRRAAGDRASAATEARYAQLLADLERGRVDRQKIAALAITEPGGGSDVANLRTKAVRAEDGGADAVHPAHRSDRHQQKFAESIHAGVARYFAKNPPLARA